VGNLQQQSYPGSDTTCPLPLTLAPGSVTDVGFSIDTVPGTAVRFGLELNIQDPSSQTLVLPAMMDGVAMTSSPESLEVCYKYKNDQFQVEALSDKISQVCV
jgi:hypothetical protein